MSNFEPTLAQHRRRLLAVELARAFEVGVLDPRILRSMSIGRARVRRDLRRVLRGLHHGTCHLAAEASSGTFVVGRVDGAGCSWFADFPETGLDRPAGVYRSGEWSGTLSGRHGRHQVGVKSSLSDGKWTEEGGWSAGEVSHIHIGEDRARTRWLVAVTGLEFEAHDVTLDAATLAISRLDRTGESVVEVRTAEPIGWARAVEHVATLRWLVQLAQRTPMVQVAVWAGDHGEGAVTFGALNRSLDRPLVEEGDAADFVRTAAATWTTWSEPDRVVARAVIDGLLIATASNLEASIALTASSIELLIDEWIPGLAVEFSVAESVRDPIKRALVRASHTYARGSEFDDSVSETASRLFNRTAKKRFAATLVHYDLDLDEDGVKRFVNVRNKVVHGGFQLLTRDERFEASEFGRWMLSACIARRLGHMSPIVDRRRRTTVRFNA